MSTTVKVFIVLNLLLALAVFWITAVWYATGENWKRRWHEDTDTLGKEMVVLRQKVADESYAKVLSETQAAKFSGLLTESTDRRLELEAKIKSQDDTIAEQNLTIRNNMVALEGAREEIAALTTTLDMTRQRNAELTHIAQVARAVAFQLNVKLAEVEDDYNNATTELQKRDEAIADKDKTLKSQEAMLAQVRTNHPEVWKVLSNEAGAAFIQGVVAAVRVNPQGQQDLVMISIGKDEGISEGLEFIVFRANQYIVKVRVERVMNDMAACRVIPTTWNTAGHKIQQGDLAQNRL